MIGYPAEAWGTLQSGGSLATLACVVAARETRPCAEWSRGVLYFTAESHLAIRKALHVAGLSGAQVRQVPMDADYCMDVAALAQAVAADRKAGLEPWMIFATAGTTNTGAIDPLAALADLAERERVWFHVDGAYGGFFVLTKRAGKRLAALSRADSVVLDPHKGLFLPYGCGAGLVRNGAHLRAGFAFGSDYLVDATHDTKPSPADYSPELTRHFRGLRLWMSLKLHGLDRFTAALEEKLALAEIAQTALAAVPELELGPAPQLSCVAFRVRAAPDADQDAPTVELLRRMQERGRVLLSSTRLHGRFFLRICVLSFRSHKEDIDAAIEEITTLVAGSAAPMASS
jgi:glutamate/tyrosine decarboxylase-like PLP-dependent enzyme